MKKCNPNNLAARRPDAFKMPLSETSNSRLGVCETRILNFKQIKLYLNRMTFPFHTPVETPGAH